MSSASPMAERRSARPLRHPAEIPFCVFMVVLNIAIVAFIVRSAVVVPYLPERLQDSAAATAIRTALIALLLLIPGLIVIRETQRAGVRGTAVQLSPRQYPERYRTAQAFAEQLGLRRRPDIFLANGNGALNAFAAQATGARAAQTGTSPRSRPARRRRSTRARAGFARTGHACRVISVGRIAARLLWAMRPTFRPAR